MMGILGLVRRNVSIFRMLARYINIYAMRINVSLQVTSQHCTTSILRSSVSKMGLDVFENTSE